MKSRIFTLKTLLLLKVVLFCGCAYSLSTCDDPSSKIIILLLTTLFTSFFSHRKYIKLLKRAGEYHYKLITINLKYILQKCTVMLFFLFSLGYICLSLFYKKSIFDSQIIFALLCTSLAYINSVYPVKIDDGIYENGFLLDGILNEWSDYEFFYIKNHIIYLVPFDFTLQDELEHVPLKVSDEAVYSLPYLLKNKKISQKNSRDTRFIKSTI